MKTYKEFTEFFTPTLPRLSKSEQERKKKGIPKDKQGKGFQLDTSDDDDDDNKRKSGIMFNQLKVPVEEIDYAAAEKRYDDEASERGKKAVSREFAARKAAWHANKKKESERPKKEPGLLSKIGTGIKNVAKKVVGEDAKPIDELSAELLDRAAKKSASYYQPQGDPDSAAQRRQTKRLKSAAGEKSRGEKSVGQDMHSGENRRKRDIKKFGAGTEFSPSKDEGVGVGLGSDGLSSGKLGGIAN